MPRPARKPRPEQRQFFKDLRAADIFKAGAFAAHLSARGLGSPAEVSRMENGEKHLRFDVLLELLKHLEEDAEVALDWMRQAGEVPEPPERDPVEALHAVVPEAADVIGAITRATSPGSPGGAAFTPTEAGDAIRQIEELLGVAEVARTYLKQIADAPVVRAAGRK